MSNTRVPALDGARGIAIALVLLHHCQWPRPLSSAGWMGVDLFFVLSGYLITGILADTRGAPNRASSFYTRRALRIFPLYYGLLIAVSIVSAAIHRRLLPQQAWYWTYLSAWPAGLGRLSVLSVVGHFWSLSIEEQFYWLWPIVVWSVDRRAMMWLCGVLVLAASVLRIYLVTHTPSVHVVAYLFPPTHVDGLVVGALIALALRGPGGSASVTRWMYPVALTGAALLLAVIAWRRTVTHEDPWMILVGFPAIACAFGGLVLYAATSPAAILRLGLLRTLGKYSYGLYVLHYPIVVAARLHPAVSQGWACAAVVLPTSFAAAYLSYHLFEKRFLELKDRFGVSAGALTSTA